MNTRRMRSIATRSGLIAVLVMGLAATVSAADGLRFKTDLLSTNEIHDTDSDGSGKAIVSVDAATGLVCFDLSFRDSGTPNRAHIHAGDAATASGPIVIPFFDINTAATAFDPRHDELESTGRTDGCVTVSDQALLADIAANPGQYYVNLHNARFPPGSMRGQLDD
jgi:CHRD domain